MNIQKVDNKYVKNNKAINFFLYTDFNLLLNSDEILFLSKEENVYEDKYLKTEKLFDDNLFITQIDGPRLFYTSLFELNKPYISARIMDYKLKLDKVIYLNDKNSTFICDDSLIFDITTLQDKEFNREEIEQVFNTQNYNSIIVVDNKNNVLFAKDKNFSIGKTFIPTDDEIINIYNKYYLENKQNIDEIESFSLSGYSSELPYIIITSKDDSISISKFNLSFLEKDCFKLSYTQPLQIKDLNTQKGQLNKEKEMTKKK